VGKIILLNTPIGNLSDLTPRVRTALESGEYFAAEDTRVFKELLNHLGISLEGKQVHSLHDQSENSVIVRLLELAERSTLYVTSDAGSPIISDPAFPLVSEAIKRGISIESFSGISSPVMALELSGLPPMPFHFFGFLPREGGKKKIAFQDLPVGTSIFFEAPTRIEETLDLLSQEHPESSVAVVRELSKKFEQVLRFKACEWESLKKELTFKGEFVLLIHRSSQLASADLKHLQALAQETIDSGAHSKTLAKLIGAILDRPSKEIYSELSRSKDKA